MASLGVLPVVFSIAIPVISVYFMFSRKRWDPEGKHCFITGSSSGTGLSLAILLAKKGAHVSIVARDKSRLKDALGQVEAVRQNSAQILRSYSFTLDNLEASKAALDAACAPHEGKAPDAVFTCAGQATPGFFVEQTEQSLLSGMKDSYWLQVWPALAATQKMVRDRVQGRIVFISSTLGFMSFIGYNNYAPGKHALRGIAEGLRSELILYGIDVHCFFPCTIYTPGYEHENKTKPQITRKIEETDTGLPPDKIAQAILKGVQKGQHQSAADILTHIFRSSTRGSAPSNNIVVDFILDLIGWIGIPIWRRSVDQTVRSHRKEHEEYLIGKGFFK